VKILKPEGEAVLACGVKRNTAKLISTASGDVLYDFSTGHHEISAHPLTLVDNTHHGRLSMIAGADGNVHLSNVLLGGDHYDSCSSDETPVAHKFH